MKNFSKNFLPELHVNPIYRDVIVVVTAGLLIAVTFVTVGVMIFSQL